MSPIQSWSSIESYIPGSMFRMKLRPMIYHYVVWNNKINDFFVYFRGPYSVTLAGLELRRSTYS